MKLFHFMNSVYSKSLFEFKLSSWITFWICTHFALFFSFYLNLIAISKRYLMRKFSYSSSYTFPILQQKILKLHFSSNSNVFFLHKTCLASSKKVSSFRTNCINQSNTTIWHLGTVSLIYTFIDVRHKTFLRKCVSVCVFVLLCV